MNQKNVLSIHPMIPVKDQKLDILVIPDFHGNRSPLADPNIRGSIHGLNLETTPEDLFLGAIQGLALGTRQIINQIESVTNKKVQSIVMTGGLSKSALFNQGKFAIHYPQPCIFVFSPCKCMRHSSPRPRY